MSTNLTQQIDAMFNGQICNESGDNIEQFLEQFTELFKNLESDCFNFHSNRFEDFLQLFDLGEKLCKRNLFGQERFWNTLLKLKFSRIHRIERGIFDTCIQKSLELDSQWPSWKLLVVLNNLQRDSPSIKQELKQSISKYLIDYPSFTSFITKIRNFQQLFHLLRLISTLDKVKPDSPSHSILNSFLTEEGKEISAAKFKPSAIMKFIFNSDYLSFQNMWKVNTIDFVNKKNNACSPIDPLAMQGISFFLVQFIYDKLYIIGANCSVLELNRADIKIVKDLRNNIKLSITPPTDVNTDNPRQNVVSSAELAFGQGDSCDQFFYEFTGVSKISIPKRYIALDYTDTTNENESEETPNVGLPETPDELSDLSEHLVTFRPETSDIFRTQLPATPQNSDPKVVIEMNERHFPAIEEDSPLTLKEQREKARETAMVKEIGERPYSLSSTVNTDSGVSNSLVITKINEKTDKKVAKNLAETFNKPQVGTELTNLVRLPQREDISLLNSIFDSKNTSSVTNKKKKFKTAWRKKKVERKVRQQRVLKNVHPVVIIPTQTVSQLEPEKQQIQNTHSREVQVPESAKRLKLSPPRDTAAAAAPSINTGNPDHPPTPMDGPAHRTRRKSPLSTKHQEMPRLCLEPHFAKEQEVTTPMRTEASLRARDISEIHTGAENTTSITCVNASTSVIENPFKGEGLHHQETSMFIGDLQQQINHSIASFTESLSKKMELINQELGERILTDLSSKYRTLFTEMQQNFQNDTEEMLSFIDQIKNMLKLPEPELVQLLKSKGKRG